MMNSVAVTLEPGGRKFHVELGTTALRALQMADEEIDTVCGGNGQCGKCRIRISGAVSDIIEDEKKFLTTDDLAGGWRMACMVKILGPVTIDVPRGILKHNSKGISKEISRLVSVNYINGNVPLDSPIAKVYVQVPAPTLDDPNADLERVRLATGFETVRSLDVMRTVPEIVRAQDSRVTAVLRGNELVALESGDIRQSAYGIAFDIGTTTVVGFLVDLIRGKELATASRMNTQAVYGADLISRIRYSVEDSQGLKHLQEKIVKVLNGIIDELVQSAGVSRENIYEVTVAGNTCMQQLFLGLASKTLAEAPYAPVIQDEVVVRAKELELEIALGGYVTVFPGIAGFVGGDTVGVLLATAMDESDDIKLLIDIGTNSEIVLGSRDELICCSAAAGPAFEGARITYGMRGTVGAIEKVVFSDDVRYEVVGNVAPIGICGSGLIDIVAELVKVGILDKSGRILDPSECDKSLPSKLRNRIRDRSVDGRSGYEFVVADCKETGDKPIVITQQDIREVQLAKGAIRAGIEVLKDKLGIDDADISEVLLAGAFGNYIQKESAATIGLIPAALLERVRPVGNAAGVGSKMALVSLRQRERGRMLARRVKHVELSRLDKFQEEFIKAMGFSG